MKKTVDDFQPGETLEHSSLYKSLQGSIIIQDNKIVYANTIIQEITGYSNDELLNIPDLISTLVHPDYLCLLKTNGEVGTEISIPITTIEIPIFGKDGKERWLLSQISNVFFNNHIALQVECIDISERKNLELSLQKRLELEHLVSTISTQFISTPPENVEEQLKNTLEMTGRYVGVDRCFVDLFDKGKNKVGDVFEWIAEGAEASPLDFLMMSVTPWIGGQLRQGNIVRFTRMNEVPKDARQEKKVWNKQGIQSILVIPLIYGNELLGYWGFVTLRSEKEWSENDVRLLQVIGNVLSNTIARNQMNEVLRKSEEKFNTAFNVGLLPIIIINWETKRIFDINKGFEKIFGFSREEVIGERTGELNIWVDRKFSSRLFTTLRHDGKIESLETVLNKKDDTSLTGLISAEFIEIDHQPFILAVINDITKQKQAEESERRQRTFAEALSNTAAILNSTLDFERVLDLILESIEGVFPHNASMIYITNEDQKQGQIVRYRKIDSRMDDPEIPESIPDIDQLDGYLDILSTGKPFIVSNCKDDNHWSPADGFKWVNSIVSVPIKFGNKPIGILSLLSETPGFYIDIYARRLQAFANQAAVAIRNARLYERAKNLAAIEERQRLAREIHDAVSQTLFSTTALAEILPSLIEKDPREAEQKANQIFRLTRAALAEMRTLLLELRPHALMNTDLGQLIRQLADGFSGHTKADLSFKIEGRRILPPEVQTTFFRIAQEALNNISKHARATRVDINLVNTSEKVELHIVDNGHGFDVSIPPKDRLGLTIMQERADKIGARLCIDSKQDKGTAIHLTWLPARINYDPARGGRNS